MSRLKLPRGVSRTRRTKLQVSIDQTIADDIELLAAWSHNETTYIVNELLRFAIAHEEDFLKYRANRPPHPSPSAGAVKLNPTLEDTYSNPAAIQEMPPHVKTACA